MKRTLIIFLNLPAVMTISAQQADRENNRVRSINRELARAAFIAYDIYRGDRTLSLEGMWKFCWSPAPEGRIADLFTTVFNDSGRKSLISASVSVRLKSPEGMLVNGKPIRLRGVNRHGHEPLPAGLFDG